MMEYAEYYFEGKKCNTIKDLIETYAEKNLKIPEEIILQIMTDLSEALDYAHKSNIFHKDLKDSNAFTCCGKD